MAEALSRARELAGPERVRLLAGRDLLPRLRKALPDLPPDGTLAEPEPRGTGPALAWAAHHVADREPGAVMVSLHADHRIAPLEAFRETMDRAIRAARRGGRLFCVGIPPDRPETGFGYVRRGARLAEGVYEARSFEEKPERERAREYLASGEHLWNTGLFVWRASDFLDVVRDRTPELAPALPRLDAGDVEGYFERVRPISVDVGVMERAPSVGVVEATFEWDDLGVWPALARILSPDGRGNVAVGDAALVEAAENVVWSEDGRVVLFGVEGLVVARSGGQTLVTTRERAPDLKRLLASLEEDAGRREPADAAGAGAGSGAAPPDAGSGTPG